MTETYINIIFIDLHEKSIVIFESVIFLSQSSYLKRFLLKFSSNYHQNKSREQLKINLRDLYSKLKTEEAKHKTSQNRLNFSLDKNRQLDSWLRTRLVQLRILCSTSNIPIFKWSLKTLLRIKDMIMVKK